MTLSVTNWTQKKLRVVLPPAWSQAASPANLEVWAEAVGVDAAVGVAAVVWVWVAAWGWEEWARGVWAKAAA